MIFVGPMRKGERRPKFCIACDTEITFRRGATSLCLKCAEKRQTVLRQLRHKKKTPFAAIAHRIVGEAVKVGMLPKLDGSVLCVDCGKPAAQYDHRHYLRPLEVEPVCVSCNKFRGFATPYMNRAARWPSQKEIMDAMKQAGLPPLPAEQKGLRAKKKDCERPDETQNAA